VRQDDPGVGAGKPPSAGCHRSNEEQGQSGACFSALPRCRAGSCCILIAACCLAACPGKPYHVKVSKILNILNNPQRFVPFPRIKTIFKSWQPNATSGWCKKTHRLERCCNSDALDRHTSRSIGAWGCARLEASHARQSKYLSIEKWRKIMRVLNKEESKQVAGGRVTGRVPKHVVDKVRAKIQKEKRQLAKDIVSWFKKGK
jgi:hypothetical protein